jgi:hypothetical protein
MPTPDDTTRPAGEPGPSELVVLFAHEAASRLGYLAGPVRLAPDEREAFAITRTVCDLVAEGNRA